MSEKHNVFLTSFMKTIPSINKEILTIINHLGRGSVFTPTQFLKLGNRSAIDKTLSRLAQQGVIRRLAHGIYDYPKTHPQLGVLEPSTDNILALLANSEKLKIQPSGAYAANLLGLSEQVPMKMVFLTDGTPRHMVIGKREIILKRTSPRQMETAGRISGLVIQALKYLGKFHLDLELLKRLKSRLNPDDKQQLFSDIENAPGWMAVYLRELAKT